MDRDSERAVLLVLLAAVGILWIAGWSPQLIPGPDGNPATDPETVGLGDDGPRMWPYTATEPEFDDRVSPINLVFDADPETVESLFLERPGDWERRENATGNETLRVPPEDLRVVGWTRGDAASRYVYVTGDDREADVSGGEWRTPTYHLFDGDHFGTQRHLRVYDATVDGKSWTVVQVHSEHWDWFSLTHRVDSVDRPRKSVERELVGDPRVRRIDREYFGNGDSFDADGWTTVVTLAGVGLLAFPVGRRLNGLEPWGSELRGVVLFLSLAGIVLGIRGAGLLAEAIGVPSEIASKVLYAVLAAGVPLLALSLGRGLEPEAAFRMGAVGFALGLVVDYAVLSVTVLPLALVVHRVLTVLAVGVLATGLARPATGDEPAGTATGDGTGTDGDRTAVVETIELAVGIALWLLLLVVPHLGL